MLVYAEMLAAVESAAPDKHAVVASALAKAYGAGGLTDEQYEQLDGLLAARRRLPQPAYTRARTLNDVAAQVVQAAPSPLEGGGAAPAAQGTLISGASNEAAKVSAHHRTGSRPRKPESMGRRRRWAAAGYVPPKLAAAFTAGEQAVLAVVGKNIAARGTCTLAMGAIAALAGVSETTARRALRQAALVGLLTIELRRITGFRNDTNVLRIASAEWAAWLRLRLPRSARADLGIGCQKVQGTKVSVGSKCVSVTESRGFGNATPAQRRNPAPSRTVAAPGRRFAC